MIPSALNDFRKTLAGKAAAALVAGTALFSAASLPAANDAFAGEPQTAAATQPVIQDEGARPSHMMREMRKYSEDPATKGIGVFINLQQSLGPADGKKIGGILKNAFASKGIPLEFCINQSRGAATGITFYVKGVPYEMTLGQIRGNLGTVLSRHQGAWLPEKLAAAPTGSTQQVAVPANKNVAPEIRSVDKRGAWLASKENGGTLVIWYDARHHKDAVEMVRALKMFGKKNVVALAGRDDGGFVLVGNGRTGATVFTLGEARDGTLGDEALIFAKQRNIP